MQRELPTGTVTFLFTDVEESVGLQADDDIADWLAARRVLLVRDNLEHLQEVAAVVSNLLVGDVVVLATSRAPLHLSAEREPGTPWPRHRKGAPMRGKRMQGESAKRVTINVLRAAGEPLHTKEITKRVLESGRRSGLKGKAPEATVAAMLAIGSKPGGSFKRVDKATYALADDLT